LHGLVQAANGPREISKSVQKMIKNEENLGIHRLETFENFATKLRDLKNNLLKLLHDLKTKKKKIAGYGASVGVTTILHQFGIDKNILDFLVDDNPMRHNLYSPGMHIPVLNPQAIYKENPDYVLILAWQYAEPIIHKHKAYLNQGGRFITFLPKIEIKENHKDYIQKLQQENER